MQINETKVKTIYAQRVYVHMYVCVAWGAQRGVLQESVSHSLTVPANFL